MFLLGYLVVELARILLWWATFGIMPFDVQEFANNPRLATLAALKKSELLSVANHYKVEVPLLFEKPICEKLFRST